MFLNQLPSDPVLEWLPMQTCAKIACVDKNHRQIISSSRWARLLYDPKLQETWKKYVDAKSESEKLGKELDQRSGEIFKKFSFSNLAGWVCGNVIGKSLKHHFSFVKEGLEAAESISKENEEVRAISLRSDAVKREIIPLRAQFFAAKEDAYVMALFGGREKYKQLPEFLETMGAFQKPFEHCQKKYLQGMPVGSNEEPIDQSYEKVLFLHLVAWKLSSEARQQRFLHLSSTDRDIMKELDQFPEFLLEMKEKFAAILSEINDETEAKILSSILKENFSAPVTRFSMKVPENGFLDGFAIKVKNTATQEDEFLFCYTRDRGTWRIRDGRDIVDALMKNDIQDASLFETYQKVSNLLTKGEFITEPLA